MTVTENFGAQPVRAWTAPAISGEETVMRLLMRNANLTTKYGGGFVESIDGHSGAALSDQRDWFYYVNGVQASKGAAATVVHSGDRIWWDLHNWSQTDEIPAVVGSFPEPFLAGIEGKRLPVRIECTQLAQVSCEIVSARLRALGVPAGLAALGPAGEEPDTLRIIVGAFSELRAMPAAHMIEQGPGSSGVYARLPATGASITVLDSEGQPVRTLYSGSGLIAATRSTGEDPVWIVTGTDGAGVLLAAHALDSADLHSRFALALESSGALLSVPAPGS
jgi:hypothetical protein